MRALLFAVFGICALSVLAQHDPVWSSEPAIKVIEEMEGTICKLDIQNWGAMYKAVAPPYQSCNEFLGMCTLESGESTPCYRCALGVNCGRQK